MQRLSLPFLERFGIDSRRPSADRDRFLAPVEAYEDRWYENWDVLRSLIEPRRVHDPV